MQTNHVHPPYSVLAAARVSALLLVLAATLLAGLGARALAQANANPPPKLTYQGFLTDQNGVPAGNTAPVNRTIIFRIYDALTSGNKLWASQQTVTVDKGHFSVLLGEGSAVGSEPFTTDLTSLFTGSDASDRFLELTVDNTTIAPRLQFLPSPYAFLARKAVEVDGGGIVSGTIPAARLSGADGSGLTSLNGSNIATGTVPDGRLSVNVAKLNTAQTFTAVNTFAEKVEIKGNKVLQFGSDVAGREGSAGSIGYATFTSGALDIVGAGSSAAARKVKMHAEGGLEVAGPVTATSFSGNGAIPIGGIIMWSGTVANIPSGWALCNGLNNTPNLQDRFIVGAGNAYAVKNTGGNANLTLSVAQLPPHTHTVSDAYYAERRGLGGAFSGSNDGYDNDNDLFARDINTGSTGSGQAIDIRPPFYALAFIMRVQ